MRLARDRFVLFALDKEYYMQTYIFRSKILGHFNIICSNVSERVLNLTAEHLTNCRV